MSTLKEMYKGIPNSPETIITSDITASQTTITVEDTSAIPELPNLLVLGGNTNEPETVKAMFIDGNTLTVERGFQGSAQAWEAGTKISRNFTAYDYNTLVENINDLQQQHNEHKAENMPHQFINHKENKTYKFGFQVSVDGKPQIIYEEVV